MNYDSSRTLDGLENTTGRLRRENGVEMASYFHIWMSPGHFHVDVASCFLNLLLDERGVLCSGKLNFVSKKMEGMSKDMALDKFNSR